MTVALSIPPPGFDDLSEEAKLDYVQALWDRLTVYPERVSTPDWHREILAERLAEYHAGEGSSRPWSEVSERLRSLLQKTR